MNANKVYCFNCFKNPLFEFKWSSWQIKWICLMEYILNWKHIDDQLTEFVNVIFFMSIYCGFGKIHLYIILMHYIFGKWIVNRFTAVLIMQLFKGREHVQQIEICISLFRFRYKNVLNLVVMSNNYHSWKRRIQFYKTQWFRNYVKISP